MGRRESDLFDLSEVVVWISVQGELSDWDQWEFLLGPCLGNIEWIELDCLGLLESHNLEESVPRWEFSLSDGIEQIADRVIGIGSSQSVGSFSGQVLDSLSSLEVELAVVSFSLFVGQLESM